MSPLTLMSPLEMRCSRARREPRPAWASTLCRRSSSFGASVAVSRLSESVFDGGFGVSLMGVSSVRGRVCVAL